MSYNNKRLTYNILTDLSNNEFDVMTAMYILNNVITLDTDNIDVSYNKDKQRTIIQKNNGEKIYFFGEYAPQIFKTLTDER